MPWLWANIPEVLGIILLFGVWVVLFVSRDRRLHIVPLMLQYALVIGLISPQLSVPLFVVRITLGAAISAILLMTAFHAQRAVYAAKNTLFEGSPSHLSPSVGRLFEGVSLGMGVLVAFGIWRIYPINGLPPIVTLVAYELVIIGLILALLGGEPLRIGVGLLFCLNGFEMIYFLLEKSLLAIALTSNLDLLVALAIAYQAEHWLHLMTGEPTQ